MGRSWMPLFPRHGASYRLIHLLGISDAPALLCEALNFQVEFWQLCRLLVLTGVATAITCDDFQKSPRRSTVGTRTGDLSINTHFC